MLIENAQYPLDHLEGQWLSTPVSKGAAMNDVMVQRSWRYDAAGRVRAIDDQRWGRTLYDYDNLGQLIQARRGTHREVFDYDAIGSLQGVLAKLDDRESAIPWGVATGNVLHGTKEAEYTNDANHRRKTKKDRKTGAETTYLWDCRDRLREVRLPDGRRALYTYDAFGRRVRKETVPKQTVQDVATGKVPAVHVVEFLWDGDALAAEYDSERGSRAHVHEPGTLVPVLQAEQGEVLVVVCDHLGMPKELIGQDGKLAWSAAHSAWGRVVEVELGSAEKRARDVESPFRLLGQYADEETGLCYTRFRYFEAGTGRWLSPDPLGILGGLNLLAFDGAPTDVVDPLGLACEFPRKTLDGVTLAWLKRNKPKGWQQVPTRDREGWIWKDKNGVERLRFMRPTGKNPGANQWSRQANGYFRWQNDKGEFLDHRGKAVPLPPAITKDEFMERTHIVYDGPMR